MDLIPNSHGALLEIPGVVSFGQSAVLDSSRIEDHVQVVESATIVRGAHQFGFGASLQHITLDARLANRFAGVFIFPTLDDFAAGRPTFFCRPSAIRTPTTRPIPPPSGSRTSGVPPPVLP